MLSDPRVNCGTCLFFVKNTVPDSDEGTCICLPPQLFPGVVKPSISTLTAPGSPPQQQIVWQKRWPMMKVSERCGQWHGVQLPEADNDPSH